MVSVFLFQPGAVLANHDNNSFELFQRLPEADVQSSAAISLIYENLQKLDIFLSSRVCNSPPTTLSHVIFFFTCQPRSSQITVTCILIGTLRLCSFGLI